MPRRGDIDHADLGVGDLDWQALVKHLTGRFTCHLPSFRGRGLSGHRPDLGPGRLVDDFVAYVDSIGEATGLVGWGAGAGLALAELEDAGFFSPAAQQPA